jgi:predicted DNA-binding transcriptional regulator YafY
VSLIILAFAGGLLAVFSQGEPGQRVIHPYQIVQRLVWWYVIAWCEQVGGFRHFRVDRLLEAKLLVTEFAPRSVTRATDRKDGEKANRASQ